MFEWSWILALVLILASVAAWYFFRPAIVKEKKVRFSENNTFHSYPAEETSSPPTIDPIPVPAPFEGQMHYSYDEGPEEPSFEQIMIESVSESDVSM
jgi:hypothetical protein